MAKINHGLAIFVWLAVCVALVFVSGDHYDYLFFAVFCLWPHAVTHWLCFRIRSRGAAKLLGIGMVAYAAWFFFAYADAFYFNLDALNALAMVVVGFAALPVLLPVWLIAIGKEKTAKRRAGGDGSAATGA